MAKTYKMSDGNIRTIKMEDYSEDEFMVASLDFLGTTPNSHRIEISEEVFRRCASSVLGKWLVAEVEFGDATTHTADECIQGYVPREQEVRFTRDKDGYLRGVVDVVISKQYSSEFCEIFRSTNHTRAVSVEMMVEEEDAGDKTVAKSFNIVGVTVLGILVKPSSPGSNIDITRFTEKTAQKGCEDFYRTVWQRYAEREQTELDAFVRNRKKKLEGKTYQINSDELKETPWGEVDKTELKDAVMGASNRNELVKKVYLKVQDGWEDAPSENLKYPVMELDGNTFYYNRFALASALAYARQEDETDVISKIIELYKKFDLVEEGEEENMSKKKFEDENAEALEQEELEVSEEEEKEECEQLEDDGEDVKDEPEEEAEEQEELSEDAEEDDMSEPEEEGEPEPEECADEEEAEEEPAEEDAEDMAKDEKIKELEDIIMAKDAELEELRAYKEEKENAERDFAVQQTLEEIRECVDSETFEALKNEGMGCKLAEIDGWKNKAKSMAFDAKAGKSEDTSKWSMSIPQKSVKKSTSKWDSIN